MPYTPAEPPDPTRLAPETPDEHPTSFAEAIGEPILQGIHQSMAHRPVPTAEGQQQRCVDIQAARDSGPLPHEILLAVARGEPLMVARREEGEMVYRPHYPDFKQMVYAAEKCAPYYAPKLSMAQVAVKAEVKVAQAVMLVPAVDPANWEEGAAASQAALKESVQH